MKKYIILFSVVIVLVAIAGITKFVTAKKDKNFDLDYVVDEILKEKEREEKIGDEDITGTSGSIKNLSNEQIDMVIDELERRGVDTGIEECKLEPKQKDGKLDFDYYIDEIVKGNGEVGNELCGDDSRLLWDEIKKRIDAGILYQENGALKKR